MEGFIINSKDSKNQYLLEEGDYTINGIMNKSKSKKIRSINIII